MENKSCKRCIRCEVVKYVKVLQELTTGEKSADRRLTSWHRGQSCKRCVRCQVVKWVKLLQELWKSAKTHDGTLTIINTGSIIDFSTLASSSKNNFWKNKNKNSKNIQVNKDGNLMQVSKKDQKNLGKKFKSFKLWKKDVWVCWWWAWLGVAQRQ